jgi:hypothetical protein
MIDRSLPALPRAAARRLLDAVALAPAALLLAVALLLLARRVSGALTVPLGPAVLLAAGVGAAATVALFRVGWRTRWAADFSPAALLPVEGAASAVLLSFALTLSLPGSGLLGLTLLWSPLVVEELLAWRRAWAAPAQAAAMPAVVNPQPRCDEAHDEQALPADEVLQQLTRSTSAEGVEQWHGWLRLPLVVGQRSGALHVAFCPPLGGMPEIEFEQIDGPEARLKLAQAATFGARIEVKLVEPVDEPASVLVQFVARSVRA